MQDVGQSWRIPQSCLTLLLQRTALVGQSFRVVSSVVTKVSITRVADWGMTWFVSEDLWSITQKER